MGQSLLRPPGRCRGRARGLPALGWITVVVAVVVAVLSGGLVEAGAWGQEAAPCGDGAGSGASPRVMGVEIRSDVALTSELVPDPQSLLAFSVGGCLSEEAVRRTLRNIQATGIAAQAAVYSRPVEGGVVAVVALWGQLIVEKVEILGELGALHRSQLAAGVEQREGEPLLESRILRSDFRLEEILHDAGYLASSVALEVVVDEERKRARVAFRVHLGPRFQLGYVELEGKLGPFTAEELKVALRTQPGRFFQQSLLSEDPERLERWLFQQSFRKAQVAAPRTRVHEETSTVDVVFPVEVGPRVVVRVEGAELERLRKEGLLPFLGVSGYDEALVLQAVDKIKASYQRRGHYQAEVTSRSEETESEETEDELTFTLGITPGPTFTLTEIHLQGNQEMEDSALRDRMLTSERRLLRAGSGRLVDEVLAADLKNLRSAYALDGYVGFEVGPPQVEVRGRDLVLTLPIEEGVRRRVSQVEVEGFSEVDLEGLEDRLSIRAGGPFHSLLLEESLDALRSALDERGYGAAQVSARQSWSEDGTSVAITFQGLAGPQQRVGRILVRGNTRTRTGVILRNLGVRPGDPVSGAQLLELERNLYHLGVFSRVEVSLVGARLGLEERDVLVRVEEARVRRISYGVGYDSEDGVRGTLGFSHLNLSGRAATFRADARLSQRERRFRLVYDQPADKPWLTRSTFQLFRVEEDQVSYDATRLILEAEPVYQTRRSRFSVVYDLRRVESDLDSRLAELGGVLSPLEEDGEVRISSLIPSLFVDHRDDPLDPTRGWLSAAQLQIASSALLGEVSYLKLLAQQAAYLPLGKLGVVAASARVGAIEPLDRVDGEDLLSVPLDERLYAGGRNTHRAYPRQTLGIPGQTLRSVAESSGGRTLLPVGGNGLLLFNLDYRFPIVGSLGGTLFFDTGNVWSDWRDASLGGLKSGVGVGLRYLSPIGPLRLDVAWKLDREPEEDPSQLFLSFGHAF